MCPRRQCPTSVPGKPCITGISSVQLPKNSRGLLKMARSTAEAFDGESILRADEPKRNPGRKQCLTRAHCPARPESSVKILGFKNPSRAVRLPRSPAASLKTKILAEEGHHVILKTISHLTRVSALIHFEAVRDSIPFKNVMQLAGIDSQTVLLTHIDRNCVILAQTSDVLIHKSERGIRRPFRENVGLDRTVLQREVQVKWRVLWVG